MNREEQFQAKKNYIDNNKELFENFYKDNKYKENSQHIFNELIQKGIYSSKSNKADTVGSMNKLYNKMYKQRTLKKSIKQDDNIKQCPLCGGDMHRTHPAKSNTGQILYYRRWTCSCGHYESKTYKKPTGEQNEYIELNATERDEIYNRIANKNFKGRLALQERRGKTR